MNKSEVQRRFEEIHQTILHRKYVTAGTLIRFRDACIEQGKQQAMKEIENKLELIKKFRDFRMVNSNDIYNEIFMGEMFGIDTALNILKGKLKIKENGEIDIDWKQLMRM